VNDMRVRQQYSYPFSFVEFPKKSIEQSITQRFEQQVQQRPEKAAVKFQDRWVAYDELNQTANRLARVLPRSYSGQLMPVAILVDQGITLIVAILAVLKAGLIYAPVDRRQPEALLAKTLVDLEPCAILTDGRNVDTVEALSHDSYPVINAEADRSNLCGDNLDLPISPDAAAYVFYTSGSTGEPKGVLDSHRNVLHNVMRYTNSLGFSPEDRMSLVQHSSFSGTVSTIFGALLNGAAVFPFDLDRDGLAAIAAWAQRERITIFHSVPSIFRQLAADYEPFPELRLIRLEGDKATAQDIKIFQKTFADSCILVNGLGVTECGLLRQIFIDKRTSLAGHVVPVGYQVEDMEVQVIDESGDEVPAGKIGEVVVRSPYLALGYWRKPELTAEKFDRDRSGVCTYRTGDLGAMSLDGCLDHLGRKDLRTKIGGNNVDMANLEHVILAFEAVEDALVQPYIDRAGEQHLGVYLVPKAGAKPTISDVREFLETRIPSHMIPTSYVFLTQLPLTRDGKVDLHGLPALIGVRPFLRTQYVAPETPVESFLGDLWAEVLELEVRHIGVLDSFFDLGGESIRATKVVARLASRLGMVINVSVLFEHRTIRTLSQYLDGSSASGTDRLAHTSERAAKQRKALARRAGDH
jgi:amino acid adenylation domain-containing protein